MREKIEEVGDVDVVQGTSCGMTLKWGSLVGWKSVTYSIGPHKYYRVCNYFGMFFSSPSPYNTMRLSNKFEEKGVSLSKTHESETATLFGYGGNLRKHLSRIHASKPQPIICSMQLSCHAQLTENLPFPIYLHAF